MLSSAFIQLVVLLLVTPTSIFALHDSSPRIWGSNSQRLAFSTERSRTSLFEDIELHQSQDTPGVEVQNIPSSFRRKTSTFKQSETKGDEISHPPRIIIIGGPASGKGTQCENIANRYGVLHLSVGDILREAVKEGSAVGRMAKQYMDRGELVPDSVIIDIVSKRLDEDDCRERGWLLDGFPRTKAQAEHLARMGIEADVTLLLSVSDDELVQRVVGRRMDPVTGKTYHLKFRPPPLEVQDRLEQRSDDTVESMERRLEQYHNNLSQIRHYLEHSFVDIDGSGAPDIIAKRISRAMELKLRHRVAL
jgi:adenylate kinase